MFGPWAITYVLVEAVVGLSSGTVLSSVEEVLATLTACWGDLERLLVTGDCLAGGVPP